MLGLVAGNRARTARLFDRHTPHPSLHPLHCFVNHNCFNKPQAHGTAATVPSPHFRGFLKIFIMQIEHLKCSATSQPGPIMCQCCSLSASECQVSCASSATLCTLRDNLRVNSRTTGCFLGAPCGAMHGVDRCGNRAHRFRNRCRPCPVQLLGLRRCTGSGDCQAPVSAPSCHTTRHPGGQLKRPCLSDAVPFSFAACNHLCNGTAAVQTCAHLFGAQCRIEPGVGIGARAKGLRS